MRIRLSLVAVVVMSALAVQGAAMAVAQMCTWQWVSSMPPEVPLTSVAHGDGRYVAVGGWGVIVSSVDTARWTVEEHEGSWSLRHVIRADGLFVAVGEHGVLTSADGQQWSTRWFGEGADLVDVAHGAGGFVAVGPGLAGDVLTSTDAVQWSRHASGFPDLARAIEWTGTVFVAIGGEPPHRVYGSADGLAWSLVGTAPGEFRAWIGDRYALMWDGTQLLLGNRDGIFTSPDGGQWEMLYDRDRAHVLDITSGGGAIVASRVPSGWWYRDEQMLTRWNDGDDWIEPVTGEHLSMVAWDGGQFVVSGDNGVILVSSDGEAWAVVQSNLATSLIAGAAVLRRP